MLRAPQPARAVAPADREPTVAVVVAAYNASATIEESLRSALDQTRPPDEVVVCDDGSDDADQLARVVAGLGPRVRLVAVPHGGEAVAKNAAVAATSSEVVCLLDADDVYEPGRLAAIATAMRDRPDLDMVTTDAWHERDGAVLLRHYDVNAFPVTGQREAILEANFVFGLVAVRRTAWDAVGGFDRTLQVGADWDCWLRLVLSGHLVGLVDEPLARYRLSGASLSGNRARAMRARVLLLDKAAREQRLTDGERAVLRRSRRHWLRAAVLAEAREAVAEQRHDARRRCLTVVATPGVPAATRAKHLLGAACPALAHRVTAG